MRADRPSIGLIVLLIAVVLLSAPAVASPPRHYYLSLGDSLAIGMQPSADGSNRPTGDGYVDFVGRRLRASVPELTLAKLGCAGETTASMLAGGRCRYASGSQLAEAEAFLAAHRGAVRLVTVDIGDNDVESCFGSTPAVDRTCIEAGLAALRTNLPVIAARLRAAAGRRIPIVGLTDYDQFLAWWLHGRAGRALAVQSVDVVGDLNGTVDAIYRSSGFTVADASTRFATNDLRTATRVAGHGLVPRAVARVCRWTWACSGPPIGMNDHANATGYGVLADTIEAALGPRLFSSR